MQDKRTMQAQIGPKLKQYRIENDLTLEEMAVIISRKLPKKSAVHYSTLARIENGDTEPNDRTLYKIQKAIPSLFNEAA